MRPVRVLIIEDHRDCADTLRLVLDLLGYETRAVYVGEDGLRLARDWRPAVVLCDLDLPGISGYEVAEALKASPETAHACLVAVTGYGGEEGRRAALARGFDHHFPKPADPAAILRVLPRPGP